MFIYIYIPYSGVSTGCFLSEELLEATKQKFDSGHLKDCQGRFSCVDFFFWELSCVSVSHEGSINGSGIIYIYIPTNLP